MVEALCDDLNTPQAIAELHKLYRAKNYPGLLAASAFLGFSGKRQNIARTAHGAATLAAISGVSASATVAGEEKRKIENLIEARNSARKAKNFAESDRIRDELAAMGVVLKDSKDGTTWEIAR